VDGNLPDGYPEVGGTVKDIMGHTLFLLMSALKSENVTVVLDSCFAGGATREERVRSRNGGNNILVSADEKMYQEQWLSRLNMSPEDFVRGYREGVAKGVVLAATAPDQLARELNINGFKAGIFSYLLTHFLWQEDSNIERVFQKILPEIPQRFNQMPRYEVKPGREYHQQSLYFINTPNSTAQAVVTEVKGDTAELWLGGVDLRKVTTGGVRDENLLAASLARPRHLLAYEQPDLFELAAAYGYALAKNHPFIDGNKRTAFAVMATFLLVNGYLLDVPEMDVVQMMERLASDRETQKSLAKWLRENSVLEE
jgi:death-on-curing family protein